MAVAMLVGFALGLLGAIPVAGPIAILVIHRGLRGEFRSALLIATGSAVAEGLYAALAFLGFGALLSHHEWLDPATNAVGAVVLATIGIHLHRQASDPRALGPSAVPITGPSAFGIGLGIAASNPAVIASWAAAGSVVHTTEIVLLTTTNALALAAGTVFGIVTWSAILLGLVARVRGGLAGALLLRVQRGAALLVMVLACGFAGRCAVQLA